MSRKHARRFALVAVVAAGLACFPIAWRSHGFRPPGPLIESEIFGDYQVRIYQRHEKNLAEKIGDRLPDRFSVFIQRIPGLTAWDGFEILKQGRRVYSQYGGEFRIAEFGSNTVAGLDITGNGTPKLALAGPLGRQGGGTLLVFECGKQFRKIATVDSWGNHPELRDLDHNGIPALIVSDNSFYHWPVCRDGEPMPGVILRWRNGKYIPAPDLMFRPAPPQEELDAKAAKISRCPEWDVPQGSAPVTELAETALGLMYAGHEDLAWKFIKAARKPEARNGFGDEDHFTEELRARLDESEYWPEFQRESAKK